MVQIHILLDHLPRSILCLLVVIPILVGCSSEDRREITNNPPVALFTGGPTMLERTQSYYSIEARWMGWDFDGEIDHFQYALDPNPDPENPIFTNDEINYPEIHLGTPVRVGRGPGDAKDTLFYGKTIDGEEYTYTWIQTREYSQIFNLSTLFPEGDPTSVKRNDEFRYFGYHTMFIRSVDNEGAVSKVDYLSTDVDSAGAGFTVVNIVPETKITSPLSSTGVVSGSNLFTIHWEGHDPDTRDIDKLPTSYLWKLIRIPSEWERGFVDPNFVMYRNVDYKDIPWIPIGGDTTTVTVTLVRGKRYLFSIRAVDEAGGTEAHLTFSRGSERGGNTLFIQVNIGGRPELTVHEPTLGTQSGTGFISNREAFEVPLGGCLRFEWEADAEGYAGQIALTNYGWDIVDLDNHSPGSGWSGWREYDQDWVDHNGRYRTFEPKCFPETGLHTFYVKARDLTGASTIVAFLLEVVDFTFDYPILYVDDSTSYGSYYSDESQEAFWLDILQNSGRYPDEVITPELAKYDVWGAPETALEGNLVPLSILGKYRLLFWDLNSTSYRSSGFSKTGPWKKYIGSFLRRGGQLMYFGIRTAGHALGNGRGDMQISYPLNLVRQHPTFPYTFLGMFTTSIGNCIINGSTINSETSETLYYVEPMPGGAELPRMSIDPERSNLLFGRGLNWDFIRDPISEPAWFTGTIDSLYRGHTVGPHLNNKGSSLDGRIAALRMHHDPGDFSPRAQGRSAWFGFPLFYFHTGEVQEMVNTMLDWFLEEAPYSRE